MKKTKTFYECDNHVLIKTFRIMRITFFLLLVSILQTLANDTYSQVTKLSLDISATKLVDVLDEIEEQSEFYFLFNEKLINTNREVSINVKNEKINEILDEIFKGTGVVYTISDRKIILAPSYLSESDAQQKSISGTVTDEAGQPLPGVTVLIKGTTNGTVTNMDGNYSITNIPEDATLVFSFVGMISQEVVIGAQTSINVIMVTDAIDIDEVVAIGYGTMKKINLTGAVDHITSETLSALNVNTMGEALQGQMSSLNVSVADGKPGRGASFNIRGMTSINGGSPLIVIDGVPQTSREVNNLSPQDIEGISILKDAASAAIYGARASYGVILITTKRAPKGDLTIEYNNNFGFSKPTWMPDVYDDPVGYYEIFENEFNKNIGHTYLTSSQLEYVSQVASDSSLPHAKLEIIGGKSTLLLGGEVHNYYKEWFREYSPRQNHHISMKGGSEKFQYYISADYNHEEGALEFKPDIVDRYTLRSNVTYNMNKNISLYNNISLIKRNMSEPNDYLYSFCSNVWRFIENTNPLMPEYVDVGGEMIPTDIGFYREFLTNQSDVRQRMHEAQTTLGVDISLFSDKLKIHADATYQFSHNNKLRWWDNTGPYLSHSFNNRNIILAEYKDAGPGNVYRSIWNHKRSNINLYATYSKILGKHETTFMAGFNQEEYDYMYFYADHKLPITGIPQHSLNLATGDYKSSDDDDRNSSRSTFFRVNYNYNKKYLLEINGCYNLSSKFDIDDRAAFFASVSGGWRISEESFFEPLKNTIDNLKIRGSYGSLGNQNIGSYDYIPIMSVNQSNFMLEGSRVNYTSSPNPKSGNFTWETSETIDAGIDIAFLKNRFTATFDYYERNTKNMLAPYHSLPSVFGAIVPKENIASLRNRGWDMSVNWKDEFTLRSDKFRYGIRVNVWDSRSVITDYFNPTNYLGDYYIGQEIGEIWGLTTLGFFATDEEAKNSPINSRGWYKSKVAAGCIKFDDIDENGKINNGKWTLDNPGDFKIIGNSSPRYQYGITVSAGWKGFDINAFFKGVGKRDIYPGTEATNFWSAYNRKYQVLLKHVVENRWTPENPDAYFPRPQGYIGLGNQDLGTPQTKYLQDASYLRCKNLTIGYTIPKQLIKKIKTKNIRLYVSGQNLFEWTKLNESLDPEGLQKDPDGKSKYLGLGTAYRPQRIYSFGLEVRF